MKRVLATLTLTGIVWAMLQLHDSNTRDPIDDAMIVTIAMTFWFAAAVMLIGKKGSQWSARATGILLTTLATAYFYSLVLYGRRFADAPAPEWATDVLRSLLMVGGPLFLYGLITWTWVHWRVRRPTDDPAP